MSYGSPAAPDGLVLTPASFASIRRWSGLALALLALNFALTFHNVWPTLWITTRFELSIEIAILLAALVFYTRTRAVSSRVLTILALVLTLMAIGRYAEVTAPALYGRPVNLYWDAQYLPDVAAMLFEVANPLIVLALVLGCVLLLLGVAAALRFALVRVTAGLVARSERRVIAALAGVLIVVYAAGHTSFPLRTLRLYSLPVTHTYWQQAEFLVAALGESASAAILPAADPLADFALSRVDGADVIVQFVESYGAVAFDSPLVAAAIAASRAEFDAALAATNRRVVSAFVESPTFGGASWLAHSSFMTGLDIRDSTAYDLLLTQDRATLSSGFTERGYRSVALMPGLKNEWPEGAFYRFANIYGSRALAYQGPEFGWWRIPDQFALARLAEIEMQTRPRQPLFAFFPTISTHMPFRPTPPYQADWARVLSREPFDAARVDESLARLPEWTNMQPAYAETLAYTFTYLSGFLRTHADARLVWIILGDHQPAASVSGKGARWDVPVHVVTGNTAIADALIAAGFTEGLTPATASLGPMHDLPRLLLRSFAD
jgi:hypothetical protein